VLVLYCYLNMPTINKTYLILSYLILSDYRALTIGVHQGSMHGPLLHIFETNWWHLWKPRYGLPLLSRWYSNLHRSRATWQFERYTNEARERLASSIYANLRMDLFKFTKAEPGQNRSYDFCSKTHRYDNVTLSPPVLQWGLRFGPIQRNGAN
jgi:hypothetical protein